MDATVGDRIRKMLVPGRLPRIRRNWRRRKVTAPAADEKDAAFHAACLNCGAEVTASFCPECGQRDDDFRRPLWTFISDLSENILTWDSRLLRTIGPLVAMPGYLTRAYMEGKRARFMPPVRLYVLASVLFFLTVSLSNIAVIRFVVTEKTGSGATAPLAEAATAFRKNISDELAKNRAAGNTEATEKLEMILAAGDKALAEADANRDLDFKIKMFSPLKGNEQAAGAPAFLADIKPPPADADRWQHLGYDAVEGMREVFRNPLRSNDLINTWLPRAMFVLLPVFALLLRIFYPGRGRYLVGHLVFSLHFHSFVFLLLTTLLLAQMIWGANASAIVLALALPLYLLVGLKVTSRQGWIKTLAKFTAITSLYLIIQSVTVSTAVLYGLTKL